MRKFCLLFFACTLSACANRPSPPPDCEGIPVPINAPSTTAPQGANHATRSGS